MLKMDQENEISTIETLPNEILLMIFTYINGHQLNWSVSKVCRRWKYLISHIIVKVRRTEDEVKIHGGVMALLVSARIPSLPVSSALVCTIATSIPHLKELTICADYPLGESELKIIETLHNLRHLDIITEINLEESTPISCNITSLVVNNNMAPGFLFKMKNPNRVIKAFHMYGTCMHYPIREMEMFLRHHSINLSELTLRCAEFKDSSYETVSLCEGLTSLRLYRCSQLTAKGATCLTNLMKLQCLHLTGASQVLPDELLHFIRHLPPHIAELNLSNSLFGDEHCRALVAASPNLRCFEMWGSMNRLSISQLAKMIQQLKCLEYFDTDVILYAEALRCHESLKYFRCRYLSFYQNETRLRVNLTLQTDLPPYRWKRKEGPSSVIFYYWQQDYLSRITLN